MMSNIITGLVIYAMCGYVVSLSAYFIFGFKSTASEFGAGILWPITIVLMIIKGGISLVREWFYTNNGDVK